MKKLFFCFFTLLYSFSAYPQLDHSEILEKFLSQRKKMVEEIMKAFDNDSFFKDGFFDNDDIFESLQQRGFSRQGENVKIEEVMEEDGGISIFITPLNKNLKLDIETANNMITIKSEMVDDVEEEGAQGASKRSFRSQSSRSISIPEGFEAKSPVQDGEKIKISLVPAQNNKNNKNERVPIKKGKGERTI